MYKLKTSFPAKATVRLSMCPLCPTLVPASAILPKSKSEREVALSPFFISYSGKKRRENSGKEGKRKETQNTLPRQKKKNHVRKAHLTSLYLSVKLSLLCQFQPHSPAIYI